jgi:hypothetical protein
VEVRLSAQTDTSQRQSNRGTREPRVLGLPGLDTLSQIGFAKLTWYARLPLGERPYTNSRPIFRCFFRLAARNPAKYIHQVVSRRNRTFLLFHPTASFTGRRGIWQEKKSPGNSQEMKLNQRSECHRPSAYTSIIYGLRSSSQHEKLPPEMDAVSHVLSLF